MKFNEFELFSLKNRPALGAMRRRAAPLYPQTVPPPEVKPLLGHSSPGNNHDFLAGRLASPKFHDVMEFRGGPARNFMTS